MRTIPDTSSNYCEKKLNSSFSKLIDFPSESATARVDRSRCRERKKGFRERNHKLEPEENREDEPKTRED